MSRAIGAHLPQQDATPSSCRKPRMLQHPPSTAVRICVSVTAWQMQTYMATTRCESGMSQMIMILISKVECISDERFAYREVASGVGVEQLVQAGAVDHPDAVLVGGHQLRHAARLLSAGQYGSPVRQQIAEGS